jgi:hypothetical protein
MLREYEYALERFAPGLEKSAELGDPVKLLGEVRAARAEVERLYGEIAEESVGSLTPARRAAGSPPNAQLIAARLEQIMDPARLPASLGKEAGGMTAGERVDLLARLIGNEEALKAEVNHTIATGEVRPRLRQLMEIVSPEYARGVLAATPMNAGGRRAALRQINRQAQLAGAGWGGTFSRGQKVGRGGLALFEVARIVVETAAAGKQLDRALTTEGINDFNWWTETGALPPFSGVIWHPVAANEVITVVDAEGRYDHAAREKLVEHMKELDAVTLGAPADDGSWLRFAYWVEERIRNFDDFETHFLHRNAPVKWTGSLTDATWTLRVTSWNAWTGLSTDLQQHEALTKVMSRAAARVIAGTASAIERTWERRATPLPAREPPRAEYKKPEESTRLPGESPLESLRPTRHARFKSGSDRELFGMSPQRPFMRSRDWLAKAPYFMAFETLGAPAGFVVVGGADYNTYAAIRTSLITRYSGESVLISPEHDTPEERNALNAVVDGRAEREELRRPLSGRVAIVRYLETVPNESATALAKLEDLDFVEPRR